MPTLLLLDSSADLDSSRSRAITAVFADEWRSHGEKFTVVTRDLHRHPVPHLSDSALHWPRRLRPAGAPAVAEAAAASPVDSDSDSDLDSDPDSDESLQQTLITELLSADVLLVGAPLYNYSIPSSLKAWIDHIHVPGVTAPFDLPTQPLAGRPAVIVSSRGGSYDAGTPTADWDHGVPVLELILGNALGMSTSVITTNLTLADTVTALADQRERSHTELAAAKADAVASARSIAAGF